MSCFSYPAYSPAPVYPAGASNLAYDPFGHNTPYFIHVKLMHEQPTPVWLPRSSSRASVSSVYDPVYLPPARLPTDNTRAIGYNPINRTESTFFVYDALYDAPHYATTACGRAHLPGHTNLPHDTAADPFGFVAEHKAMRGALIEAGLELHQVHRVEDDIASPSTRDSSAPPSSPVMMATMMATVDSLQELRCYQI